MLWRDCGLVLAKRSTLDEMDEARMKWRKNSSDGGVKISGRLFFSSTETQGGKIQAQGSRLEAPLKDLVHPVLLTDFTMNE